MTSCTYINYRFSNEEREQVLSSLRFAYKDRDCYTVIKNVGEELPNRDMDFYGSFTKCGIKWNVIFLFNVIDRKIKHIEEIKSVLNNDNFMYEAGADDGYFTGMKNAFTAQIN